MLQRTIRTLELKVGSIQSELSSTQAALSESQLEYENYKVSSVPCLHGWSSCLNVNTCCVLVGPCAQCVEAEIKWAKLSRDEQ